MSVQAGTNQKISLFAYEPISPKKKQKLESEEYADHHWCHFGSFYAFLKNMNPTTDITFKLTIYLPFIHLYPLKVRQLSILLDNNENLVLDEAVEMRSELLILTFHYLCNPSKLSSDTHVSTIFKQVNDLYFHPQ